MKVDKLYAQAEKVLALVIRKLRAIPNIGKDVELIVEGYQNGRENGFQVHFYGSYRKSATFAESRNSDSIVVYLGNTACQGLTDEAYKTAKFFPYQSYDAAANYIVKSITSPRR